MAGPLRDGDGVIVGRPDRPSHSLNDMLHTMETIGNAGARLRSLTGTAVTTSARVG
jgi:hypothetical protein